jgi:putative ABC transport system permease protein
LIGTVLANTLGEYVGVALMSSFGVSTFHFEINPLFAYVFSPLLLAACVYVATLLGTADIRRVKIFEHIKEA